MSYKATNFLQEPHLLNGTYGWRQDLPDKRPSFPTESQQCRKDWETNIFSTPVAGRELLVFFEKKIENLGFVEGKLEHLGFSIEVKL